MQLPDLTTTDYVGVFAGSVKNDGLRKFKRPINKIGATAEKGTNEMEGHSQLLIQCTYQRSKTEHRGFLALRSTPENEYSVGLEFERGDPELVDRLPKVHGVKPNKGVLSANVSVREFETILSKMWSEAALSETDCYIEFRGLFDKSEEIRQYFSPELLFNESPLDILYGVYGIRDQAAILSLVLIPSQKESTSDVNQEHISFKHFISYATYNPDNQFKQILPCPPKLTDLRSK